MDATAYAPRERRYLVRKDVHFCVGGNHVVFLDLATDHYFGMSVADASELEAWVGGWPLRGEGKGDPAAFQQLLEAGLLTTDCRRGILNPAPAEATAPKFSLRDLSLTHPITVRWHHVLNFLRAALVGAFALRVLSMRRIAATCYRRRAAGGRAINIDEAHQLISIFQYLYPWFFAAKNECLRNSLRLRLFLGYYDLAPEWVFAVRTDPFSAHCWLQHGNVVLNDGVATTACFTPIMVI